MEAQQATPVNNPRNTRSTSTGKKPTRTPAELLTPIQQATKRKRNSPEPMTSKNKRQNGGDMDPTNAQLMRTLDSLAESINELPNKNDIKQLENQLLDKMYEQQRENNRRTQDNARKIKSIKATLHEQKQSCLLYTSPSPRDRQKSRMPSSA